MIGLRDHQYRSADVITTTDTATRNSQLHSTRANAWGDPQAAQMERDHEQPNSHAERRLRKSHSSSRIRSQSENATPLPLSSLPPVGGGGVLFLDSDDEEQAGLASSPVAPNNNGITISTASSGGGTGVGISIPTSSTTSHSGARARLNRRDFFLQSHLSPTSSEDEDAELQMYSTSYAGPRDLSNFTFEMAQMTGYLEKQSLKNPDAWKRRWFVMQDNVLFYYRSERDAIETKPTDRTCCGAIQLDSVDSVTTAKDFGVGAFQIRLSARKYILRADTKECMHDWLFNFQKSIANIISVLLRTKGDHRMNRVSHSVTRRSFSRVSRSVSFDHPDAFECFGRMSADFPSHHFQSGFVDPGSFSDDSVSGESSNNPPLPLYTSRTSPRRASSPQSFAHYGGGGARSPIAMFAFDPPFDSMGDDGEYYGGPDGPLIEGKEEEDEDDEEKQEGIEGELKAPAAHSPFGSMTVRGLDAVESPPLSGTASASAESPMLQRTFSPPVPSEKWVPRFLRDRENAVATAPPPAMDAGSPSPPPPHPSPPQMTATSTATTTTTTTTTANTTNNGSLSWLCSNSSRDKYVFCTHERDTEYFDDGVSFVSGGDFHGVTSLKGVRNSMEDVCYCEPYLNVHLDDNEYAKHSLFAVFDGHCGIRAAQYLNDTLLKYLCEHESFASNPRQSFADCFKRIDEEFLGRATAELISDGSTAAVVLIRGNKLLTANAGDSRAVVSINGVALDVIEEQTPGRVDERERIEALGGWVKEERELQMSKLHSMDLSDPWIQQRAERVVRWVNVYRVNGELAVSRSIGDMDYKGTTLTDYQFWAFPEGHDRQFHGDLVVSDPEFKEIEITPEVKFLVLACDGLWDTITSQEAVNYVTEKLSEGFSTSQVSHSLADLAIRSGSSDNVSVIVVMLQPN